MMLREVGTISLVLLNLDSAIVSDFEELISISDLQILFVRVNPDIDVPTNLLKSVETKSLGLKTFSDLDELNRYIEKEVLVGTYVLTRDSSTLKYMSCKSKSRNVCNTVSDLKFIMQWNSQLKELEDRGASRLEIVKAINNLDFSAISVNKII